MLRSVLAQNIRTAERAKRGRLSLCSLFQQFFIFYIFSGILPAFFSIAGYCSEFFWKRSADYFYDFNLQSIYYLPFFMEVYILLLWRKRNLHIFSFRFKKENIFFMILIYSLYIISHFSWKYIYYYYDENEIYIYSLFGLKRKISYNEISSFKKIQGMDPLHSLNFLHSHSLFRFWKFFYVINDKQYRGDTPDNEISSFKKIQGMDPLHSLNFLHSHSLFRFWKFFYVINDKQYRGDTPGHRITEHNGVNTRKWRKHGKHPYNTKNAYASASEKHRNKDFSGSP